MNSNEPPAYNQYESATKRTARPGATGHAPPLDEPDVYRPSQAVLNYSTSTEGGDRGVYRPPSKQRPGARPPTDDHDVYRDRSNYTSTVEPERGVYRPSASSTEQYATPSGPPGPPYSGKYPAQGTQGVTDRPGPVYTQKYGPTDADEYRTTRVLLPTRTPPSARPASSLPPVERRYALAYCRTLILKSKVRCLGYSNLTNRRV